MGYLHTLVIVASIAALGCRATAEAPDPALATDAPVPAVSHALTKVADDAALAPEPAVPSEAPSPAAHHTAPVAVPEIDPVAAAEASMREITIPAGTRLSLRLGSTVSSRSSHVEDAVQATLQSPVVINGVTVVPAGTAVSGYVTEAVRSGRVKGRARIGVRFSTLRVGGTRYTMRTAAIAREAPGTKKADATKIGIGAGAGAVVGAISGGKKGAAIGTGVGAAGGTGVVLATRGQEVSLGPDHTITTRLTAPLTLRVR